MVRIFGSPDKNNINQKKILDKPTFDLKYIKFNSEQLQSGSRKPRTKRQR